MDQVTHDAAVRTVAQAALKGGDFGLASRLEASLSPPAKPEAKLEALPTESDWSLMLASGGATGFTYPGNERVNALARAILCGGVKIVDERGKGAEAERLVPCPVCGRQPFMYYERADDGRAYPRLACYAPNGMHVTTSACRDSDTASSLWNATFKERAERFPGER